MAYKLSKLSIAWKSIARFRWSPEFRVYVMDTNYCLMFFFEDDLLRYSSTRSFDIPGDDCYRQAESVTENFLINAVRVSRVFDLEMTWFNLEIGKAQECSNFPIDSEDVELSINSGGEFSVQLHGSFDTPFMKDIFVGPLNNEALI